jgi:hypothetical protein
MKNENQTKAQQLATDIKEARDMARQTQELKSHLKSLSKNQLISTIIDMSAVCAHQLSINKFLNEQLKKFVQGDQNAQVSDASLPASTPAE